MLKNVTKESQHEFGDVHSNSITRDNSDCISMSHKIFQSAKLYGFIMMVNNQSHVVIIIGHKGKPKIHKFRIPKCQNSLKSYVHDND